MTKPFTTAKGNPLMHRPIHRPMAALMLGLLIVFALSACSSDDNSGTASDDSSVAAETDNSSGDLEIIGNYDDNFGGSHTITSTTWTQDYSGSISIYQIESFSNNEDYLLGLGDNSNAFNPGTYDRFDWTTFESSLYYCTTAFGKTSAEDARTAGEGVADTTDPSSSGCGGFSWTRLDPV